MDFSLTHRLGGRAFTIFLFRHSKWAVLSLLILALAWYWHSSLNAPYFWYADNAIKGLGILALAYLAFKIMRAYFEYKGYAYRFDEEFFHLTRGYIIRQEIGVVYHQIQTVVLRHDMMDRLAGVSHLVIVLNGVAGGRQAEVILPALEFKKAQLVQRELLRQARIRAPQTYAARELSET